MTHFIQTFISGLSLGSIYALIALGYTMVYGIAKMLNFAHGDVIMIGAYSGIVAVSQMGLPPLVSVLLSILVCAVLGVLIEFFAYKPLRQAPPLSVLITAIGVSYLCRMWHCWSLARSRSPIPPCPRCPALPWAA